MIKEERGICNYCCLGCAHETTAEEIGPAWREGYCPYCQKSTVQSRPLTTAETKAMQELIAAFFASGGVEEKGCLPGEEIIS